jgi:hypothetical protein
MSFDWLEYLLAELETDCIVFDFEASELAMEDFPILVKEVFGGVVVE